jgi:hypothetical protein
MSKQILLNPLKAIRAKCLDCCCDSIKEVAECWSKDCTLHPYRFGKRPDPSKYERKAGLGGTSSLSRSK